MGNGLLILAASLLAGCAIQPKPVDTSAIAAEYIDACMGSWVYSPGSADDWQGSVRLTLYRDFRFAGRIDDKPLAGEWMGFGTLDAGVLMTDTKTGQELRLVECPGEKPTLSTEGYAGDLILRRPSP